jgi:hypothetical protein
VLIRQLHQAYRRFSQIIQWVGFSRRFLVPRL